MSIITKNIGQTFQKIKVKSTGPGRIVIKNIVKMTIPLPDVPNPFCNYGPSASRKVDIIDVSGLSAGEVVESTLVFYSGGVMQSPAAYRSQMDRPEGTTYRGSRFVVLSGIPEGGTYKIEMLDAGSIIYEKYLYLVDGACVNSKLINWGKDYFSGNPSAVSKKVVYQTYPNAGDYLLEVWPLIDPTDASLKIKVTRLDKKVISVWNAERYNTENSQFENETNPGYLRDPAGSIKNVIYWKDPNVQDYVLLYTVDLPEVVDPSPFYSKPQRSRYYFERQKINHSMKPVGVNGVQGFFGDDSEIILSLFNSPIDQTKIYLSFESDGNKIYVTDRIADPNLSYYVSFLVGRQRWREISTLHCTLAGGLPSSNSSVVLNEEGTEFIAMKGSTGLIKRWSYNGAYLGSLTLATPQSNNRVIGISNKYITYKNAPPGSEESGSLYVWNESGVLVEEVKLFMERGNLYRREGYQVFEDSLCYSDGQIWLCEGTTTYNRYVSFRDIKRIIDSSSTSSEPSTSLALLSNPRLAAYWDFGNPSSYPLGGNWVSYVGKPLYFERNTTPEASTKVTNLTTYYSYSQYDGVLTGTGTGAPVWTSSGGGYVTFNYGQSVVSNANLWNDSIFTMELWVYQNSQPSSATIFSSGTGVGSWEIKSSATNGFYFRRKKDSSTYQTVASGVSTTGSWVHLVVKTKDSWSTNTVEIYINGVMTISSTETITASYTSSSPTFGVASGDLNDRLDGRLSVMRFYKNYALSELEILSNYNLEKSRYGII